MIMRAATVISGFLAALLLGCAGYHVGPVDGTPAGARAVTVNLFQNETYEPRLSEAIAFALRRRVQQDGTYRLDTQHDGNIIVNGVIKNYTRTPVSFQPRDILTTLDYDLTITADVTATERSTGKVILQKTMIGKTTIRATANRDIAERQANPTAADDLARNITSALTEGAW